MDGRDCEIAPLDITSIHSVNDVFDEFRPDIVIHAAATKYVDLSEKFPNECIDVNITGCIGDSPGPEQRFIV